MFIITYHIWKKSTKWFVSSKRETVIKEDDLLFELRWGFCSFLCFSFIIICITNKLFRTFYLFWVFVKFVLILTLLKLICNLYFYAVLFCYQCWLFSFVDVVQRTGFILLAVYCCFCYQWLSCNYILLHLFCWEMLFLVGAVVLWVLFWHVVYRCCCRCCSCCCCFLLLLIVL